MEVTLEEAFPQAGFDIIPDIFSATQMDRLLAQLQESILPRSRAGIRHALRHPSVAAIARGRLLELAERVLGCETIPFRATLFDKSPRSNWLVVWHPDTTLPLARRIDIGGWGPWSKKDGVWYARAPAEALSKVLAHLDDSSAENGPLRVLPGTHNLGVLSDDEIHSASERIEPFACTISRGGALAMRPLLIHASSKAQIKVSRRVLHIAYAAHPVLQGLALATA